jgi:hypothetical protein
VDEGEMDAKVHEALKILETIPTMDVLDVLRAPKKHCVIWARKNLRDYERGRVDE